MRGDLDPASRIKLWLGFLLALLVVHAAGVLGDFIASIGYPFWSAPRCRYNRASSRPAALFHQFPRC
jgi:hypothetical protein